MSLAPELSLVVGALRLGGVLDERALARFEPDAFVELLRTHGVAALFRAVVRERFGGLPNELETRLGEVHRAAVTHSLVQENAVAMASEALEKARVDWVLWRGLQLGKLLYDDVSTRALGDVDLLVAPRDRARASRALERAGFAPREEKRWLTHEMTLQGHGVWLDLHWRVLRPGRSRVSLGEWMLGRRVQAEHYWQPDVTATLVVLLLHTAITEHVTRRLIRAVDVDRCARRCEVDWDALVDVCTRAGLRTAAWAMLTWTRELFDTPVPERVWEKLAPGATRARYIKEWLARDPGRLYDAHPQLVRLGFSLGLQDPT